MPVKFDIRANAYIYMVLLLFFIPIRWLFAWLIAAGFHEICHLLAIRLCGGEIYSVTVGLRGAKMECGPLSDQKKLFAVMCGPIGGFLLLLLGRWIPRTALCSWVLSMYNLLPLQSLDGGRALEILLGEKSLALQRIFLIALSVSAIYATIILHFGCLPVGIVAVLWLKNRNTPCKPGACKVE